MPNIRIWTLIACVAELCVNEQIAPATKSYEQSQLQRVEVPRTIEHLDHRARARKQLPSITS